MVIIPTLQDVNLIQSGKNYKNLKWYQDLIKTTLETNTELIDLADYFTALCGNEYTVSFTPHGPYIVYLMGRYPTHILVNSNEPNYTFDYFIVGQRSKINIVE